ncbi:MAG: hypothetical protein AAF478_04415 [Pseudomonadota bacterium]
MTPNAAIITLISTLLLLTGCSDQYRKLEATELANLIGTEKKAGFSSFRFTGTVSLFADGSAHLNLPALGEDDGKWWLEEDRICSKWKKALKRNKRCAQIGVLADGSYVAIDPANGFQLAKIRVYEL